ncbi:MAG: hypothetical protein KF855_10110 [Acidobacteria bacterium]|nr:hypothetical protein [Acidobacteriota bacterium]
MNGLEEVTKMAERLAPGDQLKLVEHLAHKLQRQTSAKKPADLYGAWKGKFPEDIDVFQEIRGIRDEWKKKFDID